MRLDNTQKLSVHSESAPTWAPGLSPGFGMNTRPDWRTVDSVLRQIAARRAALDDVVMESCA
jgi:hypothetical protein